MYSGIHTSVYVDEGSFPLSRINGSLIAVPSIHPSVHPYVRLSTGHPSASLSPLSYRSCRRVTREGSTAGREEECNRCRPPRSCIRIRTGVALSSCVYSRVTKTLYRGVATGQIGPGAKWNENEQSKGIIQETVTLFPVSLSHGT